MSEQPLPSTPIPAPINTKARGRRGSVMFLGGSFATIIVWFLNKYTGAGITGELACGFTTVICFLVVVFIPTKWLIKYQQAEDGGDS